MDEQTKQSLLAEIEQYSPKAQTIEPGDLTIEDIAKHYGIKNEAARRKMLAIQSTSNGKFIVLDVKNPSQKGSPSIKVLRKKGE